MGVLNEVGVLAVQGFAIAHGLFTIFLAILYSLTRKDTWVKDKDDELLFKKSRCLSIKSNQSGHELTISAQRAKSYGRCRIRKKTVISHTTFSLWKMDCRCTTSPLPILLNQPTR
jgi:hypothetical protein